MFVSNISWSLFNFRRGLMAEIRNRGHEVVFCAPYDDYTSKLQQLGFRYIPIVLERKGTNIFRDLSLFLSLVRIYKKEKPDWICHNSMKPNIYGAIAAYFAGCRCINTVSGLGYLFIRKNFLSGIIRILYKLAGFCAEKTFFQNRDDLQLFVNNRLINVKKCVLVTGSGVNTDFFKPNENKRFVSAKKNFVFLYLGRILWDKGIGELIESARILKKQYPLMKVNFLGMIDKGNPAGISRLQIQEWEQEELIEYLGDTIDVRPYLENCDCVVLPSYREGIPKALLEAAAMELPAIATDVPGCRDVVEEGVTGFLVKARDMHVLVKIMEDVIKMTESQRKEMGRNARAKVIKEYSESVVIKTYCAQIEQ
jgi:glycosyltransferase involved in cell wall biosynthesis